MTKGIFDSFMREHLEMKSKVVINIDDKQHRADVEVDGNLPSVLTAISLLVSNLKEHHIPDELIKGAVEIGLEEPKKERMIELHISKDNEKEIRKILEKVLKGEK